MSLISRTISILKSYEKEKATNCYTCSNKRSDGRIKRFSSCCDSRAWSINEQLRYDYLLESMGGTEFQCKESRVLWGRYVPVPFLIDYLLNEIYGKQVNTLYRNNTDVRSKNGDVWMELDYAVNKLENINTILNEQGDKAVPVKNEEGETLMEVSGKGRPVKFDTEPRKATRNSLSRSGTESDEDLLELDSLRSQLYQVEKQKEKFIQELSDLQSYYNTVELESDRPSSHHELSESELISKEITVAEKTLEGLMEIRNSLEEKLTSLVRKISQKTDEKSTVKLISGQISSTETDFGVIDDTYEIEIEVTGQRGIRDEFKSYAQSLERANETLRNDSNMKKKGISKSKRESTTKNREKKDARKYYSDTEVRDPLAQLNSGKLRFSPQLISIQSSDFRFSENDRETDKLEEYQKRLRKLRNLEKQICDMKDLASSAKKYREECNELTMELDVLTNDKQEESVEKDRTCKEMKILKKERDELLSKTNSLTKEIKQLKNDMIDESYIIAKEEECSILEDKIDDLKEHLLIYEREHNYQKKTISKMQNTIEIQKIQILRLMDYVRRLTKAKEEIKCIKRPSQPIRDERKIELGDTKSRVTHVERTTEVAYIPRIPNMNRSRKFKNKEAEDVSLDYYSRVVETNEIEPHCLYYSARTPFY